MLQLCLCGSYNVLNKVHNANGINLSGTEMFCHLLIMVWEDDLFGFIFKLSLFSYLSHFQTLARIVDCSLYPPPLTCLGLYLP